MNSAYNIEVCIASVESAIAAQKGKADRVELCDNLYEGGTTPSLGMVEVVRKKINIDLFVMIRPRGGDFLYSDFEFEVMKQDIVSMKQSGVNGFVFGILNKDGNVDFKRTSELVKLSKPLEVTFHRAIDMVSSPLKAMEAIIESGCDRILTAGRANKAIDGIDEIARMAKQADGRIKIMAGSGIHEQNVRTIAKQTGVTEFHLSGKHYIPSKMEYRNEQVFMGSLPQIPEYEIAVTDENKIINVFKALNE